jgi:hypothetical protein
MSSEEMRMELEIFVNEGLREGWRGWPRHESRGGSVRPRNQENGTYGADKIYGAGQGRYGFYWLRRSYRSC